MTKCIAVDRKFKINLRKSFASSPDGVIALKIDDLSIKPYKSVMPTAADLKSAANRSDSGGAQPIPPLTIEPLPPKIARLDPEGAQIWQAKMNERLKGFTDRVNAAITKINENIAKLNKEVDALMP